MFETYPELGPGETHLRWAGAQFTLEVMLKKENPRRIQFFYPRGLPWKFPMHNSRSLGDARSVSWAC